MVKYCFNEEKRKMLEELPQALAVYQFINNRSFAGPRKT